jgi:DNA-directed RNA polymerase specialized sigma24 family protein
MIEQLCEKDKFWRIVAYRICKDKFKADDIVQDMYLRLYDCKKEINDFYVIITMKNIFLGNLKKENLLVPIDKYDFSNENTFEVDDAESNFIQSLKWYEKELIEMSYDLSLREIQKELNINYQFVNRILQKSKLKLWEEKARALAIQ